MPTQGVPFVMIGETLSGPPRAIVESDQYVPGKGSDWPSPTYARWCAQDELEGVLSQALADHEGAQARFGTELVSLLGDASASVSHPVIPSCLHDYVNVGAAAD